MTVEVPELDYHSCEHNFRQITNTNKHVRAPTHSIRGGRTPVVVLDCEVEGVEVSVMVLVVLGVLVPAEGNRKPVCCSYFVVSAETAGGKTTITISQERNGVESVWK